jgi:hypothetical protein
MSKWGLSQSATAAAVCSYRNSDNPLSSNREHFFLRRDPCHYPGAHGLSFLITTTLSGDSHTILFDAGPESKSIARNLKALKINTKAIERIVLSVSLEDPSIQKPPGKRMSISIGTQITREEF